MIEYLDRRSVHSLPTRLANEESKSLGSIFPECNGTPGLCIWVGGAGFSRSPNNQWLPWLHERREEGKWVKKDQLGFTVTAYSSSELCVFVWVWIHFCALLYVYMIVWVCVFGCVSSPTSPGIVIVGHSVCGLDGGEVRLQGEQLTGQVWHTARRNIFIFI